MKTILMSFFDVNFFKSHSARSVYVSLFCKILTSFMFLAAVPFAIRKMGAAEYGITAFFLTMHASVGLLDSGFTYALGLRYTRRLVHDRKEADSIFFSAVPIYLTLAALALAAFVVFNRQLSIWAFSSEAYATEMLIFGLVLSLTTIDSLIGTVLQAHEKINQITLGRFLLDIVKVVGVILLALNFSDAKSIIWYILLSTIVKLIYNYFYFSKIIPHIKYILNIDEIVYTLKFAFPSVAIAVVSLLSTMIDKFLVSGKISTSAFTSYSFAVDLTTKSYFLMYAVINVIYPKLIKSHSLGKSSMKLFLIHLFALLGICAIYYLPLAIFSEQITLFLIGQELVEPTSSLIKICSAAAVMYLFYTIIETYLYTRGQIAKSLFVHAAGLLSFIFLLDVLVGRYDLYGVAIATLLMHVIKIILGSIMLYISRKKMAVNPHE